MATTPANPDQGTYGISVEVSGITIESVSITETPMVEAVPDQKNATVNEICYDHRTELKLTYRGTKLPVANNCISYDGSNYAVDSHEEAGSYNGLKRYTLSAHKFDNYPS